MANQDLYTVGKLAKDWGISENAIKKVIKEGNIQPDAKKGVCNYYTKETTAKIKKALGK
jgi:ribosomal protein L19E